MAYKNLERSSNSSPYSVRGRTLAHCALTDVHNTEFPLIKLKEPVSTSLTLLRGMRTGERTSLKLHLEQFHDQTWRQDRGRYIADQHWKLPSEICLVILLPGVLHTSGRARKKLWEVRQEKGQTSFLQRQWGRTYASSQGNS